MIFIDATDRFAKQIIFGVGMAFGAAILALGLLILREQRIIEKTWVEVDGEVVLSHYETVPRRRSTIYRPIVSYEIEFDGSTTTGYLDLPETEKLEEAFQLVTRYTVGDSITLRMPPNNPMRASLPDLSEEKSRGRLYLFVGTILLLLCGYCLFQEWMIPPGI